MRLAPTLIATSAALSMVLAPAAANALGTPDDNPLPADIDTQLSELIGTDSFTDIGEVDVESANAILDALDTGEKDTDEEYDRSKHFGSGWLDPDGNGCDARNDILARDLVDITVDDDDCTVLSGTLDDIFTDTVIDFERGVATSTDVQVDHMVPLSYAWKHGAAELSDDERREFANDPENLTATDGPQNASKGDSGPGQWLPPYEDYACTYTARFVFALDKWDLAISDEDKDAAAEVFDSCPNPQPDDEDDEETFPVGESLERIDQGLELVQRGHLAFRVTGDPGSVGHGRTYADVTITRDDEIVYQLDDETLSPGVEPGTWEFSTFLEGDRDGVTNTIPDLDPVEGAFDVTLVSHDTERTAAWEIRETVDVGSAETEEPSEDPTPTPSDDPTDEPSDDPTDDSTDEPTPEPSGDPSEDPTGSPDDDPTDEPSGQATMTLSTQRLTTEEFADSGVDVTIDGLTPEATASVSVTHAESAVADYDEDIAADAEGTAGVNIHPIGTPAAGTYTVTAAGDNLDQCATFVVEAPADDADDEVSSEEQAGDSRDDGADEKSKNPVVQTGGSLARTGADTAAAVASAAALILGGGICLWLTARQSRR
jgi:hypothetical protein